MYFDINMVDDERKNCPCCGACKCSTDFQKVMEVGGTGLVVYRHNPTEANMSDNHGNDVVCNDEFIIENTEAKAITAAEFLPAMDKCEISCPRCQCIMANAQKILKQIPKVDGNFLRGICKHCYDKKSHKIYGVSCRSCQEVVEKFMGSKLNSMRQSEATKERVKKWRNKIRHLFKTIESSKRKQAISLSDLSIQKHTKKKDIKISTHVEVGQLLELKQLSEKSLSMETEQIKKDKVTINSTIEFIPQHDTSLFLDEKFDAHSTVLEVNDNIALPVKPETKILKSATDDENLSRKKPHQERQSLQRHLSIDSLLTSLSEAPEELLKPDFKYFFPKIIKQEPRNMVQSSTELFRSTEGRLQKEAEEKKLKKEEMKKLKREELEKKRQARLERIKLSRDRKMTQKETRWRDRQYRREYSVSSESFESSDSESVSEVISRKSRIKRRPSIESDNSGERIGQRRRKPINYEIESDESEKHSSKTKGGKKKTHEKGKIDSDSYERDSKKNQDKRRSKREQYEKGSFGSGDNGTKTKKDTDKREKGDESDSDELDRRHHKKDQNKRHLRQGEGEIEPDDSDEHTIKTKKDKRGRDEIGSGEFYQQDKQKKRGKRLTKRGEDEIGSSDSDEHATKGRDKDKIDANDLNGHYKRNKRDKRRSGRRDDEIKSFDSDEYTTQTKKDKRLRPGKDEIGSNEDHEQETNKNEYKRRTRRKDDIVGFEDSELRVANTKREKKEIKREKGNEFGDSDEYGIKKKRNERERQRKYETDSNEFYDSTKENKKLERHKRGKGDVTSDNEKFDIKEKQNQRRMKSRKDDTRPEDEFVKIKQELDKSKEIIKRAKDDIEFEDEHQTGKTKRREGDPQSDKNKKDNEVKEKNISSRSKRKDRDEDETKERKGKADIPVRENEMKISKEKGHALYAEDKPDKEKTVPSKKVKDRDQRELFNKEDKLDEKKAEGRSNEDKRRKDKKTSDVHVTEKRRSFKKEEAVPIHVKEKEGRSTSKEEKIKKDTKITSNLSVKERMAEQKKGKPLPTHRSEKEDRLLDKNEKRDGVQEGKSTSKEGIYGKDKKEQSEVFDQDKKERPKNEKPLPTHTKEKSLKDKEKRDDYQDGRAIGKEGEFRKDKKNESDVSDKEKKERHNKDEITIPIREKDERSLNEKGQRDVNQVGKSLDEKGNRNVHQENQFDSEQKRKENKNKEQQSKDIENKNQQSNNIKESEQKGRRDTEKTPVTIKEGKSNKAKSTAPDLLASGREKNIMPEAKIKPEGKTGSGDKTRFGEKTKSYDKSDLVPKHNNAEDKTPSEKTILGPKKGSSVSGKELPANEKLLSVPGEGHPPYEEKVKAKTHTEKPVLNKPDTAKESNTKMGQDVPGRTTTRESDKSREKDALGKGKIAKDIDTKGVEVKSNTESNFLPAGKPGSRKSKTAKNIDDEEKSSGKETTQVSGKTDESAPYRQKQTGSAKQKEGAKENVKDDKQWNTLDTSRPDSKNANKLKQNEDAVKKIDKGIIKVTGQTNKLAPETQKLTGPVKQKEEDEVKPTEKEVNTKEIPVYRPENDLILQMVRLTAGQQRHRRPQAPVVLARPPQPEKTKRKIKKASVNLVVGSDVELELQSIQGSIEKTEKAVDDEIIYVDQIIKKDEQPKELIRENRRERRADVHVKLPESKDDLFEKEEQKVTESNQEKVDIPYEKEPLEPPKGIIRYSLSDRTFIEKGWTLLPVEKIVRKMNIYRMRPAHPEFDWFEHNKSKGIMYYDTGEKLAEIKEDGCGQWFYRNGRLALEYYNAEEACAQQRYVIHSNGEPDEHGRSRPLTILAMFDYSGNGVVFDHKGKIRLKYNQSEGVVLDRGIGPISHWKWHNLNDPPDLQQVMVDTLMPYKDPQIAEIGKGLDHPPRKDNEDMLALEFEKFVKEKNNSVPKEFEPFQITKKALKINENFSLKILDQATICLLFRDGTTNMRLNLGMILDSQEIVDIDTADVGVVSSELERHPTRTDSLAGLQRRIEYVQQFERNRTERARCLLPHNADKFNTLISKPLKPLLRAVTCNTNLTNECHCRYGRKPTASTLYFNNRLN